MASGRFADYLGKGLAADRPATPVLHPEMPGLWFSTDSGEWSAWDGTAWIEDIMAGSGIPDAPSDGTTYGRKDAAWVAVAAGTGDVVGPGSSIADQIAVFDGTTGKLLKDGGKTIAALRVPNVQTVTSSATVTPTFANDLVKVTAQAAALTLANPTGTAIDSLGMTIRIKDNGTARAISYGTQYRAIGVTLPTTTVVSKTLYLAMIYNSDDTTWDVVAVGQQA
ncbi:hypothetical protein ACYX7E_09875 [Luteimonas sp. RIT-PG2_3]